MAIICPTVTAESLEEFHHQAHTNAVFAERIHFDFMDGILAPTQSPELEAVIFPKHVTIDLHLMYQKPMDFLDQIIKIRPYLVIIHAEAEVNHALFAAHLHKEGIKAGLCLLKDSSINEYENILASFDHLLIFSGDLGHFGGKVDYALLTKAHQAKKYHPDIEIGWDGGINEESVAHLAKGGIDVLNVGGFLQKAEHPESAYATLKSLID